MGYKRSEIHTEWDTYTEWGTHGVGYTRSEIQRVGYRVGYTWSGIHTEWGTHGVGYREWNTYTEWGTHRADTYTEWGTQGIGYIYRVG